MDGWAAHCHAGVFFCAGKRSWTASDAVEAGPRVYKGFIVPNAATRAELVGSLATSEWGVEKTACYLRLKCFCRCCVDCVGPSARPQ